MRRLPDVLAGGKGGLLRLSAQVPPADAEAAASRAGLAFLRADLSRARGKAALVKAVARALSFPGWVGMGWDALQDAAADLSWLPAGGRVLLLDGAEGPSAAVPEEWATLLEVLAAAAEAWDGEGTPLLVLVRGGGQPAAAGRRAMSRSRPPPPRRYACFTSWISLPSEALASPKTIMVLRVVEQLVVDRRRSPGFRLRLRTITLRALSASRIGMP